MDYLSNFVEEEQEEDFYLSCAASGTDLLSVIDGKKKVLHSHGQCNGCGHYFAFEYLETKTETPGKWPIVYKGYYCKDCSQESVS